LPILVFPPITISKISAHTFIMAILEKVNYIREKVNYIFDKKFSTIAGTLVYFLIMSITPFLLWLTLFFKGLNIEKLLSNELFAGISPLVSYLKNSAESAASGAGVVLLLTTLYSSANFFYHLKKSGEIIYDMESSHSGIILRLKSIVYIFVTLILVAIMAGIALFGKFLSDLYLPPIVAEIISLVYITGCAFLISVVLNLYVCPQRVGVGEVLSGSLLTTALWLIFLEGFTFYLDFATPERLYGKIAVVIIFLLWCYMLMSCLVVGIIYNSIYIKKLHKKRLHTNAVFNM
jgi:YihY family inner membrane protein